MAQAGPQEKTTSIPKFTRFRGNQVSKSPATVSQANREEQHSPTPARFSPVPDGLSQDGEERAGRKRRHRERKYSRHEHHRRHTRGPMEESSEPALIKVGAWDDTPNPFFVDRKGDPSNIVYGSLHKYGVPKYARNGRGKVLGLSKDHKIDRGISDERYIYIDGGPPGQPGKRDKLAFKMLNKEELEPTLVLALTDEVQESDLHLDYIDLAGDTLGEPTLDGAKGSGTGFETSDDESNEAYRYHETPHADAHHPIQRIPLADRDPETQMRLNRAKLAQKTAEEPGNGQAWITLIKYEDEMLYCGGKDSRISAAEKRSTAEIKLSMYEKSLKTVVEPTYRECLVLGMLREGSKVWETKKTNDKWQEALRENPSYILLWIEFINFAQTNQAKFRASELQHSFKDCLQTLRQAAEKISCEHSLQNVRMLYALVLLRSTLFLSEAGWVDLSVGIWQAVLEFNLSRPLQFNSSDGSSDASLETSFEEFWESEVARMGEEGSVGWASFDVHDDYSLAQDAGHDAQPEPPCDNSWAEKERFFEFRSRMPARTTDNETSDDPYRVIMYQDAAPYLVAMPSHDMLSYLVPAFLLFCHLPPALAVPEQLRDWWTDPFVRNENLHPINNLWNTWRTQSHRGQYVNETEPLTKSSSELPPQSAFPMPNFLTSSDTLLTNHWFDAFQSWKLEYSDDRGPVPIDWILRTLKALVDSPIGTDKLAAYVIAFESIASPQTVRKTAKAMLKKRSTSLTLYNAYALIEYRFGDISKAQSILTSTISRIEHLPMDSRREIVLLWRSRVWIALETEGNQAAWKALLAFSLDGFDALQGGQGESGTTTAVLRSQKALLAMRSTLLEAHPELAAFLSELLCLAAYLDPRNEALSLGSYLLSFAKHTADHLPLPSILELLHQSRAKLLYHHATHASSFRPSELRAALTESIRSFPDNTMFLSLYAWNEARFRIDDRVRAIVQDVITLRPPPSSTPSSSPGVRAESISTHFFSVYTELSRSLMQGSNVHSIRAAFERAVDSTSCGSKSAAMWKLYVLFEINEGGEDLKRAKAVFYRAVQAVPWAKDVYMLAFEELRGMMGKEELKGLVEWMVDERGLRVFGAEGF